MEINDPSLSLSGAEAGIFQDNKVNVMADNALVPCTV